MMKAVPIFLLSTVVISPGSAQTAPARKFSPAFNICMKNAGGVTTSMRDCFGTEYQRLDAELNTRYRALMTTMPKAKGRSLRLQQRVWLADRKRVCDAAGKEEEGGTLQLIIVDQCYLDRLYDRVTTFAAMQKR